MPHRAPRPLFALLLLGLSVLALGAGIARPPSVGAEEETPARASEGQWVFDLRVVKVVGDEALAEQEAAWAGGDAGEPIVRTAWPELLAAVKERGATTILMDRRVTALDGIPVDVVQTRSEQLEVFDRRDQNNEFWKGSILNNGCQAKLLPRQHLEYEVSVHWSQSRAADTFPLQSSSTWHGHALHFEGSTLVLGHREQVDLGGEAPVTVEIWVFLGARRLPPR